MSRPRSHVAAFIILALLVAAAALAGPLDPPAGAPDSTMKTLEQVEPGIPINEDNTPGDADSTYRITQPGRYFLTGDVPVPTGLNIGIEIVASDVFIDMNGFAIRGEPGAAFAIAPRTPTDAGPEQVVFTGVTIQNGTIRGTERAVFAFYQGMTTGTSELSSLTVRDVRVYETTSTAIRLSSGGRVENCVLDVAGPGIVCTGGLVTGCHVRTSGAEGILVSESSVVDSVVETTGATSVGLGLTRSSARGVTVDCGSNPLATAVIVSNSTVEHCTAVTTGTGFDADGSPSVIRGCAAINAATPVANAGAAFLFENNF